MSRSYTRRQLKKYALSSITAMWVFTIYTMVDGIFVARGVGPKALAAVNISMPMINCAFGLAILLAIGASTKASIARGRDMMGKADEVFTMSTITVLLVSIVFSGICLLNLDSLADFLGATADTKQYVKDYLGIILSFVWCYMVAYNLEVLVKADGYPEKAIIVPGIGAVVNISLDALFIFGFGWGIKGAALATGLSQLITLIFFMAHFLSKKSNFSFVKVKMNIMEILSMVRLGVADFLTEFSMAVVIFMYNRTIEALAGSDGIVIYTVISYVSQLVLMTMVGLNQGMQPLVSRFYGKEDRGNMEYVFKLSIKTAVVLSVGCFAAAMLFPGFFVSLFIKKSAVELFAAGVSAFRLYSFAFLPLGCVIIIAGYMTATEKAGRAMIISLMRGVVLVGACLFVMSRLFAETGVWLSQMVSESISLVIAVVLLQNVRRQDRKDFEAKKGI